ncbi:hypothetical protein EW145_g99 [Phellinidium pouzarii]|uniref:Uncharacterized protein n=1 Tax=Phellinidium pouzarii TaxID=167371 RepID=A0A4S4LJL1_9AGAM|nr:hypothetical protein EW145_g99 [Phellinidium pouzarii]
MAQDGAPTIDLEVFQAQVDLSMALTNELVSSWIHPSLKSSSVARSTEKELQELLQRPPRLGVGASLPESATTSARENTKLKNKLTGKDKKRSREDVEEAVNKKDGSDEEDEEGRKGEASTKRSAEGSISLSGGIILKDGLAPGSALETSAPKGVAVSSNTTFQDKNESSDRTGQLNTTRDAFSPSIRKKKKKKKKKQADLVDGAVEPFGSGLANDANVEKSVDETGQIDMEWTGFDDSVLHAMDIDTGPVKEKKDTRSEEQSKNLSPNHKGKEAKTATPSKPKSSSATQYISPAHVGLPLLNLHGPPPSDADDESVHSSSPKKRRRRRRKNKWLGSDGAS